MRPVIKPQPPFGFEAFYRGYGMYDTIQGALIDTIGSYCSFCEIPISGELNVVNKSSYLLNSAPTIRNWKDLLLACELCQEHLSHMHLPVIEYIWPDDDETFYFLDDTTAPFIYSYDGSKESAVVSVNQNSLLNERAQNTLDLLRLANPSESPDRRLRNRNDAWKHAEEAIEMLEKAKQTSDSQYLNLIYQSITSLAQGVGFWSIWMSVFWQKYRDADLLERLFVEIKDRDGYLISGFQSIPETPTDSLTGDATDTQPRPKRQIPTRTYTIFTGTDKKRIFNPLGRP